MLPRGKHGNYTVIMEEMRVDTFPFYMGFKSLVCTLFYLFVVYTEEFNFRELPWSQRQAIFFESSQIGEYLFHLSYKNRKISIM